MTRYAVRVEIKGQSDHNHPDYHLLRSRMEACHFKRFVEGLDGTFYQLPTATYVGDFAHETAVEAAAYIKQELDQHLAEYIVFVCKLDEIAGLLEPMPPQKGVSEPLEFVVP